MIPHLELGMKCKIIPLDGSEPFEDYIKGHFVGSHFVTAKGIEIDYNGYEAIPTRHHIPIRKPRYEIKWLDMEKNLEKAIKDWVYASNDSKLIDEVWAKCLNDKKINLDRIMVEKESDSLDEDKLFADTIDETLAYINSLKKDGWTSIEQKWSGYEDNYFVACKTVLEDDDDYAKRIGSDILNEKVRIEVLRREEVDAKRKKIEALEDEIKRLKNS